MTDWKQYEEYEKEWHEGHEPQGGHDHYEDIGDVEELEEARTYLDEKFAGWIAFYNKQKLEIKPKKGEIDSLYDAKQAAIKHFKVPKSKQGLLAIKPAQEEARSYIDAKKKEKEKKDYKKKYGREPFSFSGKHMSRKHSMGIAAEFDPELDEGYKDLPPHLQKLVKKIEKKQKDWNKQNPNAKIKTLVYNPDTGKPDIEVKENTMKLVDTVKQVLDEHCGVCGEQGIEEDSDPEEKGTQGDDKEYQAKRDEILKGYGVKACGLIKDEKTKAQCFKDLDDAHVADHEEQVELEKMKKEETKESKSFSKMFSHIKSLMQGK